MLQIVSKLAALKTNRKGQDLLEYALIGGFVASAALAVFPAVSATDALFSKVTSVLSAAVSQIAWQ